MDLEAYIGETFGTEAENLRFLLDMSYELTK